MLAFLRLFFEILFGGYATPTKCVAFWRLALNSYSIFNNQEKSTMKTAIMTDTNSGITKISPKNLEYMLYICL